MAHQIGSTVCGQLRLDQQVFAVLSGGYHARQFKIAANSGQQIVEIMGYSAGNAADGLQLLCLRLLNGGPTRKLNRLLKKAGLDAVLRT